jgi:hypothetical protein
VEEELVLVVCVPHVQLRNLSRTGPEVVKMILQFFCSPFLQERGRTVKCTKSTDARIFLFENVLLRWS